MASRKNLPKIVTDIQDIVGQLTKEFELSKEPITDDNHNLHKLCAKLEFLLTSSVKERSLLGGRRSYWHWIYTCLKNTNGLSDGLRYVQANKEVQTSKGRGRAFIRYCLVHQTLADSLQNCIMDHAVASQNINSSSILLNPTYSSVFITALYDLNAVYFDLNAKGYDLDAGWPTFASKRTSSPVEQWTIRNRVESLGSLTTTSVIMDSPRLHGSSKSSSGPHSVDHRVEELVLELDQSDQKIKQQEEVIFDLESKADLMVKSTNEKEDILARVISDLESKNRHLHDAMSHMSSEFQDRDQQWKEKYDKVTKERNWFKTKSEMLTNKNTELEEHKRTLEDLVSQQMSDITSNFSSDRNNVFLTPVTSAPSSESIGGNDDSKFDESNVANTASSEELNKSEYDAEDQMKLNENVISLTKEAELNVEIEEMQEKLALVEEKYSTLLSTHNSWKENIQSALSLDGVTDIDEINTIVDAISKLHQPLLYDETHQHQDDVISHVDGQVTASLKEENESLIFDRDTAQLDANKHKIKLSEMEVQAEQYKVELESVRSSSAHRIIELEEQLSLSEQQCENHKRHKDEIFTDLRLTQEELKKHKEELELAKARIQELEQSERSLHDELEKARQEHEDEINDNEFAIEELQAEVHHHASLSESLDHDLELEKVKSSKLNGDLVIAHEVVQTFTDNLNTTRVTVEATEKTISQLQVEMKRLTQSEVVKEKQINCMSRQVEGFFDCIRLIDEEMDVGDFKLEENSEDLFVDGEDTMASWKMSQNNFLQILKKYKNMKSGLTALEKQYYLLSDESQIHKCSDEKELKRLGEELAEYKATIEIHLITIKDLSDQHSVLLDGRAKNLDRIDKLEYNVNDLSQSLDGSKHVADNLRLKIMESSAKEVELQDKIAAQNADIESLKEKITQLLLDKDSLWKYTEELRDRLNHQSDDVEHSLEWMSDNDISACSACDSTFSITLRKHHCRSCGKIFCKNCSGNWKEKNNKRVRLCDNCYSKCELDTSNISVLNSTTWGTPMASTSRDFEEIASEEGCNLSDITTDHDNGDSPFHTRFSQENIDRENTVTIAARKEMHLPVRIEHPDTTLHWDISSNRDINFKLCYAPTEDDALQELVPVRNIDSHIEPFVGELTARKGGVYTLVLDNTFSRFMSKTVTYKLRIEGSTP